MLLFLRSCKARRPPVGRCSSPLCGLLFAPIDVRNREKVCALAVGKNALLPAAPRHLPSNMCLVLRAKRAFGILGRGIAQPTRAIQLCPVSGLVRVVGVVGAFGSNSNDIFIIGRGRKCPPIPLEWEPSVEAPSSNSNDTLFANANGPKKAPALDEYHIPELCCA